MAGRPTLYKKIYCKKLIEHMSQGFSYETFCAVAGVSKQTLYDWEKANSEFLDSKREAFALCQLFWEGLGIKYIANTKDSKKLNSSVWVFNMKNRFQWRDRIEVEAEVKEVKEVTINFTSEAPNRTQDDFDDDDA